MSAVEKTNVMIILPVTIHLVVIPVIARVDTVEMDGTVQVCYVEKTVLLSFCCSLSDLPFQILMNVRIQVVVYCVMRMLNAMTLMAVMSVCVRLVTQEME